jgi:cytochrome c
MMRRLTLVCLALACASTVAVAQSGRAQRGLTFAQTNCSQCHAIGRVGESPLPEAPPFRTLHTRYLASLKNAQQASNPLSR